MSSKTPIFPLVAGAIVIALIAGVSGWAMRSRSNADPAPTVAVTGPPAQIGEPARAAPSNRISAVPPGPASMQDLLAWQAANDQSVTKLVEAGSEKLRTRYQSERVDASWASRKQQALERLSTSPQIEQINVKPLSFDALCRTSVCLIGADFPSRVAADDWFTLYTLNAGPEMTNSSSERSVNPDGSVHLQIYGLARE